MSYRRSRSREQIHYRKNDKLEDRIYDFYYGPDRTFRLPHTEAEKKRHTIDDLEHELHFAMPKFDRLKEKELELRERLDDKPEKKNMYKEIVESLRKHERFISGILDEIDIFYDEFGISRKSKGGKLTRRRRTK